MVRKSKEAPEQSILVESQMIEEDSHHNMQIDQTEEKNLYSRCGGALRAAREKQGLSVQEIASRLRLSPKQIDAIEADNYSALPEPTIVRGFIRNYAKQLKIDVEPILAGYSAIVPSSVPHELVVKPSSNMKVSGYEKSKTGRYVGAALALLLALGAWLFYQHYIEKPSPTKPSSNVSNNGNNSAEAIPENAASPAELPQAALPAAERLELPHESSASVTLPTPTTVAPALPEAVPAAAVVAKPADLPATPSLQASNALDSTVDVAPPPSDGKKRLEINATQETWVNVTDANGREIYSKIVFAGSREIIVAKPPLNITVGNAGGTTLVVDGKPMDLAPYTRVNVAHVKVEP